MRVIQLTDFHLLDPAESEVSALHAENIAAGLKEVASRYPGPVCGVITGDLTDHGHPAAYRWLKAQLAEMPFPVFTLLGNHDSRDSYLGVFGGADENGFVQSMLQTEAACLIFLDTYIEGSHAGTLCARRLDWLRARLAEAGERPVLLFMHHPPCEIGESQLDAIRLDNPDALAEVLRGAGHVRHIFCGHVHRNLYVNWQGVPVTSLDLPTQTGGQRSMPVAVIDVIGDDVRVAWKRV